jgi:hypothetical protein
MTTKTKDLDAVADKLEAIKTKIERLMGEALKAVEGTDEYEYAKVYWHWHILDALEGGHGAMQGTIETLRDPDVPDVPEPE